jgi:replicative DNA helicase
MTATCDTVRTDDVLERSVLGGVIDLDSAAAYADLLEELDFANVNHGAIWSAATEASRFGKLSTTSVAAVLRDRKRLNTIGGREYLERLLSFAPVDIPTLEQQVNELAGAAMVRRIARIARTASTLAADESVRPSELERRIISDLTEATRRGARSKSTTLIDALDGSWKRIEAPKDKRVMASFGLREVDDLTVGMRSSQLITEAGRPGSGKTSAALRAMVATARMGGNVLFWSLEMDTVDLSDRLLCIEAGVDVHSYTAGTLSSDDLARLTSASQSLGRLNDHIRVIDSNATIDDIVSGSIREHARWPLSLVVIDHLHHIKWHRGAKTEMEALDRAAKESKDLAKTLRAPVLLLAQLNRGVESRENKRPTLQDLRGTGVIEQVADVAIGLYRDEYYHPDSRDKGIAEVIVLKQRNGPTGTVRVAFDARFTRFRDLDEAPPSHHDSAPSDDGVPW